MPEIGEVKPTENGCYIWAACETCGRERWTLRLAGKPRSKLCKSCASRATSPTRENSSWWKGGFSKWQGYIYIYKPEHPQAHAHHGYIKRAILVLEEKLGRYLLPGMDSHHKNGVKDDDRPENLEEVLHNRHAQLHQLLRHRILPGRQVPLKGD